MAGNSVIGALRVVLGADTAALDKGLKDAQGSLARFSSSMKTFGAVAAAALTAAAAGTAIAIKGALENADKLGKLAQSVGLPVEELSKLNYAAKLSDVSLESLGTSLVRLSKNMSEIAAGGTGPAAQAFKALGISVREADGSMKSSSAIMSEIADKFAAYKDGANKTAIAVALFGRAGAAMIPMLNQGSAALAEAKKEAEEFGLVIDSKTAAAAETFNDNLTRLGKVTEGVSIQIAARLAPSLAQISNEMVTTAKNTQTLTYVASGLEIATKALASGVLVAVYAYKQFATVIGTALKAAMQVTSFDFSGALETIKSGLDQVKTTAIETAESAQRMWAAPDTTGIVAGFNVYIGKAREAQEAVLGFLDARKKDAPAIGGDDTNALQQYLSGIEKRKAALRAEIQTIGMSEAAQESLRIKLEGLTIAKEKNITVTDAMRANLDRAAQSFGAMSQAVQEARTRWNFVEGSLNTVASGLTDIVMRTKTAGEAFRDMALSIVRDFTQMIIKAQLLKLATSFMGGGFGGGPSLAGAGFASGIPQGVGLGGYAGSFASGGSFVVGGSGGIDSQIRTMRVTPGERVTVSKDGGYPGGGMNFSFAPSYNVQGSGPEIDRLRADMARDKSEFEARVKNIVTDRPSKRW